MVVICLTGLLFTGNLFAHGNEKHVMGTVKSVSADAIVVEATSHETETVQVTSETKFVSNLELHPVRLRRRRISRRTSIVAQ